MGTWAWCLTERQRDLLVEGARRSLSPVARRNVMGYVLCFYGRDRNPYCVLKCCDAWAMAHHMSSQGATTIVVSSTSTTIFNPRQKLADVVRSSSVELDRVAYMVEGRDRDDAPSMILDYSDAAAAHVRAMDDAELRMVQRYTR